MNKIICIISSAEYYENIFCLMDNRLIILDQINLTDDVLYYKEDGILKIKAIVKNGKIIKREYLSESYERKIDVINVLIEKLKELKKVNIINFSKGIDNNFSLITSSETVKGNIFKIDDLKLKEEQISIIEFICGLEL